MDHLHSPLTTIVSAMFFGVALSVGAKRAKIPVIAPLLLGGVFFGPEVLGIINTDSLGSGLQIFISLFVAIILFEGGLTLDPGGFKKAHGTISKLLTIGIIITWLGTAFAIYFIFKFPLSFSLLAGSLVIVTGPTVITPLLQRIRVKEKLHHILHWEGVLIDPIGVFIAILCFEWLAIEGSAAMHIGQFAGRLLLGVFIGAGGGFAIFYTLKLNWIPEDLMNVYVLTAALFLFGVSEFFIHESGILTVVVAGLVLGWKKPARLRNILQFKTELTELSIAILFVLLAANLKLENFLKLGWNGVLVLFIVIFLIRPLNIFASTLGSSLTTRDRLFLFWVAPRGIVAGSMASLFTLRLGNTYADVTFLESFTYSVIGVTVILQGVSTEYVAKWLGVMAPAKKDWLIVGAHVFARKIASFISKTSETTCILVDTNYDEIREAQNEGFRAHNGDALSVSGMPEDVQPLIGNVLALTDNRDLNELICEKWQPFVSRSHLFRWSPQHSERTENPVGTPVWANLPKPSRVAYDLRNRDTILVSSRIEQASAKLLPGTVPLFSRTNGEFDLTELEWKGKGEVLLYQQITLHLPLFVHAEHILKLDVTTYEDLISEALYHTRETHPEIPYEHTRSLLLAREYDFPTKLGHGVAIPHAHCKAIKEPICLIVRVPAGLELHAYDGELSKLFFVLLSSTADPEMHLILLADIAKIASDPELVDWILEEPDPNKVKQSLLSVKAEGKDSVKMQS